MQENIDVLIGWIEDKENGLGFKVPEQSRSLRNYIKLDSAVKLIGDLLAQLGSLLTDGLLIFLILLFILLEASIFPNKIRAALKRSDESLDDLGVIASDVKSIWPLKPASVY